MKVILKISLDKRRADELSWRSVKKGFRKVKRGYKKRVRPSLRRVARGTGHLVQRGGKWTYRRI